MYLLAILDSALLKYKIPKFRAFIINLHTGALFVTYLLQFNILFHLRIHEHWGEGASYGLNIDYICIVYYNDMD